jgi:hypothetical protein
MKTPLCIGMQYFFVKDYTKAAKLYTYPWLKSPLLFHHNLRSIGIKDWHQ